MVPSPPLNPWFAPSRILLGRWLRRLLIAAAVLGLFFAAWKAVEFQARRRLLGRARAALAQGDLRVASLAIRRAHQVSPQDPGVLRGIAELAEEIGSPEAVVWRSRLAEASGSAENRIALAITALRFNEVILADTALAAVAPADRASAAWQHAAGSLALRLRRPDAAEAHLARAARLDPANATYGMDLATLRLSSPVPGVAAAARQQLARLAEKPEFAAQALRALLADALLRQDAASALACADRLVSAPGASWRDRVLRLGALRRFHRPEFEGELRALQALATATPGRLYELALWMNANGLAREAAAWIEDQPAILRVNPIAALARAESLDARADWERARAHLEDHVWPGLEFARLAHLARAWRGLGEAPSARRCWKAAVAATGDDPGALMMLARRCQQWGWTPELEELCWKIAREPRHARWALMTAFRICRDAGDARGMLRAVRRAAELAPSDAVARNNVASLSLLLGEDPAAARRLAHELHANSPSNANFAATYAFALHLDGETRKGVDLLASLAPDQLKDPRIAAYHGILLAADGDTAAARPALELARRARLLPEEQALVDEARARLDPRPPPKPTR
jgi:Flp pilus assembly protein TadD